MSWLLYVAFFNISSALLQPLVKRLSGNPIISPAMIKSDNINGPSLIRVPSWVFRPLGRYYLYFAQHSGNSIRLAFADDLCGPWKIYERSVLTLSDAPGSMGHVASPDLHVDHARRSFRMFFHSAAKNHTGSCTGQQKTFVAVSVDGVKFSASADVLGSFYFRAFLFNSVWYAIAKGGDLFRHVGGWHNFEAGPNVFGKNFSCEHNENGAVRHTAVHVVGNTLDIYYTRIGDAPESILRSTIPDLRVDWRVWSATNLTQILTPSEPWEGSNLPVKPSSSGEAYGRENAVRDPAIFLDQGRLFLLYSIAGESGIGIAELNQPP
jgi:hypothetical protein